MRIWNAVFIAALLVAAAFIGPACSKNEEPAADANGAAGEPPDDAGGSTTNASSGASADGGSPTVIAEKDWVTNLGNALQTAKTEGKLVLVDFTATWCAPCQKYVKEVFPTPEFASAAEGFVLVKIDIDEQPDLAKEFKVDGIPDIKVLDANGNVVDTLVGFGGAEPLIAMMQKAKGA